jgi:ribosomal protein L16/L10AE
VKVRFGFVSSRINQSHVSLQTYVWVKVKEIQQDLVAPVTPGRILFEVEGVSFDIAKEALRLAAQKLAC